MPICGAKTKTGKQCQNRVSEAGQRCSQHSQSSPRLIGARILAVCGAISNIADTAQGVQWVFDYAWPYIEPLWNTGVFCPETFWWDSLALPKKRRESAAAIHAKLQNELERLRKDPRSIEDRVADASESDRKRIADAYSKVASGIRRHHPLVARRMLAGV